MKKLKIIILIVFCCIINSTIAYAIDYKELDKTVELIFVQIEIREKLNRKYELTCGNFDLELLKSDLKGNYFDIGGIDLAKATLELLLYHYECKCKNNLLR